MSIKAPTWCSRILLIFHHLFPNIPSTASKTQLSAPFLPKLSPYMLSTILFTNITRKWSAFSLVTLKCYISSLIKFFQNRQNDTTFFLSFFLLSDPSRVFQSLNNPWWVPSRNHPICEIGFLVPMLVCPKISQKNDVRESIWTYLANLLRMCT